MRNQFGDYLQPAFACASGTSKAVGGRHAQRPSFSARINLAKVLGRGGLTIPCVAVAILASSLIAPVSRGIPYGAAAASDEELRAIGIAPLSDGAETGRHMRASSAVETLEQAPARQVAAMPASNQSAAISAAPATVRVRGRITDGLYRALRSSQVAPAASASFVRLLSTKINLARDVGPDDHFDLVIAGAPTALREHDGALLFAAIDRAGASDIRLMRWGAGRRAAWIDTAAAERRGGSMVWPVAGRVSSGFGLRYHPILHFARMHKGVDFAAGWDQPVLAATDGIVSRAGWAGGYGKQVRIAHAGELATSYSHLGHLTVAAGSAVRAGQVIGYVGSTGLSTGPHLHYEVYRGGVAINPLAARFAAPSPLDRAELERFRKRLGQILAMRAVTPQP